MTRIECVCGASLESDDADLVREFSERHDRCPALERVNRVARAFTARRVSR